MKTRIIILALCAAATLSSCTQRQKPSCTKASTRNSNTTQPTERLEDFSLPDVNRDFASLSDEVARHRYTVIDFWASWCGPCRHEMPTMVKLRGNYGEEALGIVGVSLDTDFKKWTQAVDDMHMTWPQYSELKGWDSYIVQRLGISSIPYTIVVDRNMNILAEGLLGVEMERFVQSLIK